MKKWIIVSIIVLAFASYNTIQEENYFNGQYACMNCIDFSHQESPNLQFLLNKNITCIDCHSNSGFKVYVDTRNGLIDAIFKNKSLPILKIIIQNESYKTNISHFKANCKKCHSSIQSKYYNHTNFTDCNKCHTDNNSIKLLDTGSLQKMGTGGHRNKTCEDCHSVDFKILRCTDCHKPHEEMAQWGNNVCLDCHNSPHIPVRNGSFNTGISKDICSVCHEDPYETLAFYNSKHNEFNSCANCHPSHNEKKTCFNCHVGGHTSHPFAQNNCNACHGKSSCVDCHKDPHAPLRGVPKIATQDQFNDYAKNH